MDFLQRFLIWILDHLFAAHGNVAGFRVDINRIFHAAYPRLLHLLVLFVLLFVVGLATLQSFGANNTINHLRVVPDPATCRSEQYQYNYTRADPATLVTQTGI